MIWRSREKGEEIVETIEREKKKMNVVLAASTLEYLKRGGCLSTDPGHNRQFA